jgi:hypothetical protein
MYNKRDLSGKETADRMKKAAKARSHPPERGSARLSRDRAGEEKYICKGRGRTEAAGAFRAPRPIRSAEDAAGRRRPCWTMKRSI